MIGSDSRGFLLLDVLIAGLILTASVSCAMYLFRLGFAQLEQVNRANLLSEKLLEAGSLLKVIDLGAQSGTEDMGEGVAMRWNARLVARNNEGISTGASSYAGIALKNNPLHDLMLYRVDVKLSYQRWDKEFQSNVFRSHRLLRH